MGVAVELAAPSIPEAHKIEGTLRPTGYRILVQIISPDDKEFREKKKQLLKMPEEVRDREWGAQMWAKVIELGRDAYKDEKRFPSGPWCQPGDVILMRPYSGTRFMVERRDEKGELVRDEEGEIVPGDLYALINDDTVQGITTEPERIKRV